METYIAIMFRLFVSCALLVLALTGCGESSAEDRDTTLDSTVVEFDGDAFPGSPPTLVRTSIYTSGDQVAPELTGPTVDRIRAGLASGKAYVTALVQTHCRVAERADIARAGDDLVVSMIGGQDHEECFRAVAGFAVFEVAPDAVAGVRTVNGTAPE